MFGNTAKQNGGMMSSLFHPQSLINQRNQQVGGFSQAPNTSTPTGQVYTPPPVAPQAQVSSHTHTSPDGTVIKQTYDTSSGSTGSQGNGLYGQSQATPAGSMQGQIPNQQAGQPGFYLNQLQNLQNAAAPALAAPAGMNVGQGYAQTLTDYQRANLQAAEAAPALGLQATQPQQVSPGNTLVNPITNQSTYGLGGPGANGAQNYQSFQNLQHNTGQSNAIGDQISTLQNYADQTKKNFDTLSGAVGGLNWSQFPTVNALTQAISQQTGGAGNVSAANEALNALQTSLSSIIQNGGSGLTPTQITALTNGQAINTLSPAQLKTLYDTVQQTMNTKIQAYQNQQAQYQGAGTGQVGQGNQGSTIFGSFY